MFGHRFGSGPIWSCKLILGKDQKEKPMSNGPNSAHPSQKLTTSISVLFDIFFVVMFSTFFSSVSLLHFPLFSFLPTLHLVRLRLRLFVACRSLLASHCYFSFSRLLSPRLTACLARSARRAAAAAADTVDAVPCSSSHISKLSATEMGAARAQLGTVPGRLADAIVPRSFAVPVPLEDAARQETCVLAVKTPPPGENCIHVSMTGQTWPRADSSACMSPEEVGGLPQA